MQKNFQIKAKVFVCSDFFQPFLTQGNKLLKTDSRGHILL